MKKFFRNLLKSSTSGSEMEVADISTDSIDDQVSCVLLKASIEDTQNLKGKGLIDFKPFKLLQ